MRGEYRPPTRDPNHHLELPPRARRIPFLGEVGPAVVGTTSACAENTGNFAPYRHHCRNYLRVRGEYLLPSPRSCLVAELPPRARRIQGASGIYASPPGTTSACAENTKTSQKGWCPTGNYLRVRGEYARVCQPGILAVELPPRARRILSVSTGAVSHPGTTSACAENTHSIGL